MKPVVIFSSLLIALLGWVFAQAQTGLAQEQVSTTQASNTGVTGGWLAKAVNRTISLKIEEASGNISGTLEGMGEPFTLSGRLTGMTAEGTVTSTNGEAYFRFEVKGDTLTLTLANFDTTGKPDSSSAVTVSLERDFGPKVQAAFGIAGFAVPPEDPLLATWRNASITLTLKSNGASKYTGTIQIIKQKVALTATGNAKSLKVSFKLAQKTKLFSAKLEQDRLIFVLDGKTQSLGRVR